MSTKICIVRHGETDWNAAKLIQGQEDIPLNATGRAQALAAAAGLAGQQFAALYSSDLQRAYDTASALGAVLSMKVQSDAGLRERHCGSFQGFTKAQSQARDPVGYARYAERDTEFNFEYGESLNVLFNRVVMAVERLATKHKGDKVLMVAHGGVLDIVYRKATGKPLAAPRDFLVPNAAYNWIEISEGKWRLLAWAERTHLEGDVKLVREMAVE